MPKKLTSWSFSRYNTYRQCPRKAKFKFIDKLEEPGNEAMERGSRVHNETEAFINGKGPMPVEAKEFAKELRKFKRNHASNLIPTYLEDMWAFTKQWEETHWKDWANCWLRVKLDFAFKESENTMVICDVKTGKFRSDKNEEYWEQLELYALACFMKFDHILKAIPKLLYFDADLIYPPPEEGVTFHREEDLPELKAKWEERVKPMMSDTIFAPRPNFYASTAISVKKTAVRVSIEVI